MGWVPAPRYVLRRYCALKLARGLPRGRFLELGCGAGDLMVHLAELGYTGVGVEFSEQARGEALARTAAYRDRLSVVSGLDEVDGEFDLLVSCEVLEHVEDDRSALREWVARIKPGGHVLLSVPSHMKRWGASDVWAGHFRRYERGELVERLQEVGADVESLWCYGFPLANIVEPLRDYLYGRRLRAEEEMTPKQRTQRSGVERDALTRAASVLMHGPFIWPFQWLQMPFVNTELGNGYLVLARKRAVAADTPGKGEVEDSQRRAAGELSSA